MDKKVVLQIDAHVRNLTVRVGKKQNISLLQVVAIHKLINILLDIVGSAVQRNSINRLENVAHKAGAVNTTSGAAAIQIRCPIPRINSRIQFSVILVMAGSRMI